MISQPPCRRPLRADFPMLFRSYWAEDVRPVIEAELAKHGISLADRPRIFVAYPHKHPQLHKGHTNPMERKLGLVEETLRKAVPEAEWVMLPALYEAVHLGRSENQGAVYALTTTHRFAMDPALQEEPLPFAGNGQKDLFVIVDESVEQATTIANMVSFIEHNGGAVLAAGGMYVAGYMRDLVQNPANRKYARYYNEKTWFNYGRLPELAVVFARSASREAGPGRYDTGTCMRMFERAIGRHGKSLRSLTDRECKRLVETIEGDTFRKIEATPFLKLLRQIEQADGKPDVREVPKSSGLRQPFYH